MKPAVLWPDPATEKPWGREQGTVREIAIFPPAALPSSGFIWRLSLATIVRDGPFTPYPGCERRLVLIDGGGIVLDFDQGVSRSAARPFDIITFRGDDPAQCRLLGAPCRALNLMVMRPGPGGGSGGGGSGGAEVDIMRPALAPITRPATPGTSLITAGADAIDVAIEGVADALRLRPLETIMLPERASCRVSGAGIAILWRIAPPVLQAGTLNAPAVQAGAAQS
jgi:hypothetical protein